MKTTTLKSLTKRILSALDCSKLPESIAELSILLTDDKEIHTLNRDYRGKDKPTDVLSFATLDGQLLPGMTSLGDLVISIPTTRRQAKEYGVSFDAELKRLVIHGILHLMGYDHEKVPAREANRMRRLEQRVFGEVG